MTENPFTTLGLPARAGLTDEEVRAAWRRIAAATHPDREDGGDRARYGAASAAYVTLRTSFGRGEALADLGAARPGPAGPGYRGRRRARRGGAHRVSGQLAGLVSGGRAGGGRAGAGRAGAGRAASRLGYPAIGRSLRVPVAVAAVVAAATVAAVGVTPATIGLLAGALTVTGWALWRRGGLGR